MNKTETRYANLLELEKRAGEIRDYKFESIKFRLAGNTWYTPDFLVIKLHLGLDILPCEFEIHEVKGEFIREDAWLKLKISAELYPEFKFILCQWVKGKWIIKPLPTLA